MRWIVKVRCNIVLVLGLLLTAQSVLPAVSLAQGGTGGLWESFVVGDGLLSGYVLGITPTQDGALWFGTDGGVSRYDGQWSSLTERDGLPPGRVRAIAQGADGALWFATNSGLARRAPDGACCSRWTTAEGLPSDDIYTLRVVPGGQDEGVWAGTTRGLVYVGGGSVRVDTPVQDAEILATAVTSDGELLVSAAGGGVWRRGKSGDWQPVAGGEAIGDVQALWAGVDGRIWGGTASGLLVYADDAWQPYPLGTSGESLAVLAITQDDEGGLWVGANRGLFYDPDARPDGAVVTQFRAQRNGLVNDFVRALAFDRDGQLWIGTAGGVSRYVGGLWWLQQAEAVASQRINALLTDSRGRIWAGTEAKGLAVLEGSSWQHFTEADGLLDNRVIALFDDGVGRVWVSTGEGVGYQAADGAWEFDLSLVGLPALPVYAFGADSEGALWLGTQGGLASWSPDAGFTAVAELAGQRVNALHRASNGVLWVGLGQSGGLFRFADGRWQAVTDAAAASIRDVVVNGIREMADGSLWVATYNNGLWVNRRGVWERMDENLTSPKVLALASDSSGLWVGTHQGLAHYDGLTWQSYSGDILPSQDVLALAAGEDVHWIGTAAGLVRYQAETSRPWVEVDSVNLTPVQAQSVTLANDRLQVVRVRGGDLATPSDSLIYLTQLVGVDLAPRPHMDNLITAYSDLALAPGAYTLRVIARDSAFNDSQPAEITVLVPRLVRLPGGWVLRADVFYPLLALVVLAVVGMGSAGGISLRARARVRRMTAAAIARQQEALARAFNPYVSGEPIRGADMFFGRTDLLRRIFNALHQNSIMIHGERRMGKTTLLYQLAEQLRQADDPEWAFVPVYIDLEGTPQERFFYLLMDGIWGALQAYTVEDPPLLRFAELPAEQYSDREFTADLRLVIDRLKEVVAPRKLRVILLLDEMDVVSSYDTIVQQQLRRIFMSSVASNLGAVVAGIQISKAWDRVESPWYNLFNEIPLEPFTEEQARELLIEPVRGIYEWTPEAIAFVLEQAEGRPYRLQQYALEAVNQMLAARRLRITLADVQAADESIERARVE